MPAFEFTADGIKLCRPEIADTGAPAFVDPAAVGIVGPESDAALEPVTQIPNTFSEKQARSVVSLTHDLSARPVAPAPVESARLSTPSVPVTPKSVVKAARARVKELKAQLRQAKKWAEELAELERLIAAADGKTVAPVRSIDSSRRAV